MPPSKLTKTATGAALVAGSLALLGNAAPAFTQGPRYWAVNSTSDRFRHDASSVTVSAPDCIVDPGEPSGITVNLLREFWRARPEPASGSLLEQISDPNGGLSRLWDEQHDRHVLHALMDEVRPEFTDATWQAFRRLALDGASAREVAAELGLSVNAVLIAKSRVLARLRQEARGLVD